MDNQTPPSEQPKRAPIPEADETQHEMPLAGTNGADTYNFVADKIGFVPNVRKSDNALQAKVFFGVWLACILVGAILGKGDGAFMGALLGMVVALVVSGGVLTIVGLKRKS